MREFKPARFDTQGYKEWSEWSQQRPDNSGATHIRYYHC